jgi:hypothetical protein
MPINYKRVTLSMEPHSIAALGDAHEQTGIPASLIVRALVLAYAANRPAPLPKLTTHQPSVERIKLADRLGQAAL